MSRYPRVENGSDYSPVQFCWHRNLRSYNEQGIYRLPSVNAIKKQGYENKRRAKATYDRSTDIKNKNQAICMAQG